MAAISEPLSGDTVVTARGDPVRLYETGASRPDGIDEAVGIAYSTASRLSITF